MAENQFKVEGLKEVYDILNQLPLKVSESVLRSFNRKALTVNIVRPLKSVLNYSSETKKNIKVQADKLNKTAVVAGPTSSVFWVRFVDKGTKQRKTSAGWNRGRIRARNRIEPFVDGSNGIIGADSLIYKS